MLLVCAERWAVQQPHKKRVRAILTPARGVCSCTLDKDDSCETSPNLQARLPRRLLLVGGRWTYDASGQEAPPASTPPRHSTGRAPQEPRCRRRSRSRPGVPAPIQQEDDRLAKLKQSINEMRKDLMLVAAVWTCVAHRSALHHPGGYWKHGKEGPGGHAAGDPVMPSYETYRMLNTMAFMTSMLLVVMVSSERFYRTWGRMAALLIMALLDVAYFVSAMVVAAGPSDLILGPVFFLGAVFVVLAFLFFGAPRAWNWNLARRCRCQCQSEERAGVAGAVRYVSG
ncbi:uncharacterized protein LOC123409299 [Hordeum vulgare subsp. vulgare]|uniref:uncharacterized protein LOC123409299 n=1 Tax=Hordeum vulgare subsp. vulgare TaxID=112509 RepID=UPI001D1A36F3|nr:uncharacterized protein LOC123409299 [Hordeum vulgare subsp. vulgare]